MNISVMSRSEAIRYCHQPHMAKTVMISISDPNLEYPSRPFISEKNGIVSLLRLCFSDADRPGEDVYGINVKESELMTETDALKIKRVLDVHANTNVIVHCDAGISRSSGVAAGIMKALTGDDAQIFSNPKYRPNMRCYRMTLQALWRDENEVE